MKNWFIKKREEIVIYGLTALTCAMTIVFAIGGVNMIKNTTVTFDDGIEDIELTEEMVEAYVALVELSMETN